MVPDRVPQNPQGTRSSKKKKERKLNRVMGTVKKATRKGQESHSESFAALHLLHDPQVCGVEGVGRECPALEDEKGLL